jgi:hypothetical protein
MYNTRDWVMWSFLANPFSLNQIWWHQVYPVWKLPLMAESLCSNQFSPTYQYLRPALVQEEHCQKHMEWFLLHSHLCLEGLYWVPIWYQREGRWCGRHIQQPSLGTWGYGGGWTTYSHLVQAKGNLREQWHTWWSSQLKRHISLKWNKLQWHIHIRCDIIMSFAGMMA